MDGAVPIIPHFPGSESVSSSTSVVRDEELPCGRLALPVHLAFDRTRGASDFDRPQEGFAIYAAFSEAALAFAAEGKLDAQQVAALHSLLKNTIEEELGTCVRATPPNNRGKNKGNRKRQRGGGGAWCLKGSLVSYRREGKRMQIVVRRASLQTHGLVLPSDQLVVSSLDSN